MKALVDGSTVILLGLSESATISQNNGTVTITDGASQTSVSGLTSPQLVENGFPDAAAPASLLTYNGSSIVPNALYPTALQSGISSKMKSLEVYALSLEQGGTTVNGFHYDTDNVTQSKMNAAYNLAQTTSSPSVFTWWMSTGFVQIPKAQIISDAPVVAAWVEEIYQNIGIHHANITAINSFSALSAYSYLTGWPKGT